MKKQKILKISAYTSGAVTILMSLVYIFFNFISPSLLSFSFTKEEKAAIGIIGGADGPTAIFLTSKASGGLSLGALIIIFAIITAVLFLLSKYKKTNN
ncbi:sodium ion-translocating decarboxylase subunit beta [Oceanirhabdus seepicola]|nr:sodium ion-translocating decarboxylase subunit beta [Oceanirhabdus seepicola]